jgi:rod shape-determining protein MreB
MDEALSLATGLPVAVAEDPLLCVARGAGRALEDSDYKAILAEA